MRNVIILFCLLCIFISSITFAQNGLSKYENPKPAYTRLVKEAYALYKAKEYKKSGLTYAAAVRANGGIGYMDDRYNAACSWALAGNSDSAFFNLNRIVTAAKYANYRHLTTDADLNSLHSDKRWQPLLTIVQHNKEKKEEKYNKLLVNKLDTVYTTDQMYRMRMDTVQKQFGFDSKEMKSLIDTLNLTDSINLIKVKNILDQYGWLGQDVIGDQGNTALFLVIQHADLKTQEKYLPIMREAVKNGKAESSQLALLIDRVEMGNGRPQIYGSQITMKNGKYVVYKITDEVNVNKRRAAVELEPLEEYVKQWNINYRPLRK